MIRPVENWREVHSGFGVMTSETLVAAVDGGIGVCRHRAAVSRAFEGGVVGALVAVLAFPSRVRDGLGLRPGTKVSRTVMGLAAALQGVVVGACGSGLWAVTEAVRRWL